MVSINVLRNDLEYLFKNDEHVWQQGLYFINKNCLEDLRPNDLKFGKGHFLFVFLDIVFFKYFEDWFKNQVFLVLVLLSLLFLQMTTNFSILFRRHVEGLEFS